MATIIAKQSLNGVEILKTDTTPVAGLAAPIGSIALAEDGSGTFYKNGAGDTNWETNANLSDIKVEPIIVTNTVSSHTGNTNETILTAQSISANTYMAADTFDFDWFWQTIGTAGTKEFKVYLNTAATLNGSQVQIARIATTAGAFGGKTGMGKLVFDSTTLKSSIAGTVNVNTDYTNNGTYTEFTTNFAVELFIIVTGTLASGTDTVILHSLNLYRSRR